MRQLGCDSRKVQPGSLFFALHGAKTDGNAFVKDAVERGAVAIVSEERQPADLPEKSFVDSRARSAQVAGDCGGEFLWASRASVEDGCRDRHERQDHDDVDHRFDYQGFGREDGAFWDDCVSHACGRLSGSQHDA